MAPPASPMIPVTEGEGKESRALALTGIMQTDLPPLARALPPVRDFLLITSNLTVSKNSLAVAARALLGC